MGLLFVANQFKTPFLYELATRVQNAGESVCWLTPSLRWRDFLESKGVPKSRILCTGEFALEWTGSPKRLTAAERAVFAELEDDHHTLNSMLEVDRALERRPWALRERHLAVLAREITSFLERESVSEAISEYTWPIEQITALACRARGAAFLTPATIRVPSDRFAFMTGGGESQILDFRVPNAEDFELAREAISAVRAGAKPYYMTTGAGFADRLPHWCREVFEALGRNGGSSGDTTVIPLLGRFTNRARYVIGRCRLALERPFELPVPGEKFVLLTLHVQPEASIDTLARPYRDQVAGARAIGRLLPADVSLYVKEHSAALGGRPAGFYDELRAVPGLRLIDPSVSSRQLMQDALLTLAPSGTVCLEAALLGLRAVTFSKLFFSPLLTVPRFDPYSALPSDVKKLMSAQTKPESERIEGLAQIIANSFVGRIDDPINYPGCMSVQNLDRVAEAIMVIVATRRASKASVVRV